jgi:D-arabinan exo alpha-(1,3)/(1,5)-arabinofuranosidase (non-reducing end)
MKKYLLIVLVLFISGYLPAQGLLSELEQLYRIDLLPKYLENGKIEQFSSYDRTGKNDDGFKGTYSYIRLEGENQIIAEMAGPGVINRIWTPTPSDDTIQFFFDGEETPGISLPFYDIFIKNEFPFLNPICGNEVGGYYCYLPITYKKSCKVVFKGKMLFYQLQYRTYPPSARIKTFNMKWSDSEKEALEKAVNMWKNYGHNFLDNLYDNIKIEKTILKISPGETQQFFERHKGGRILGIEVEGINNLAKENNNILLMAKWDEDQFWAINAPLKDLFGYFFGARSMSSLMDGTLGNVSYIYYPMPFQESAVLKLNYLDDKEPSGDEKEFVIKVYYADEPKEKDEGKFYAFWNREINPPEGKAYEILPKISGKGHYVGTILSSQGMIPGSTGFFEGDDKAFIDGELLLHGTGSEDYFNGGWYLIPDRWDMAHSLPSHGCLGYDNALSRTGGYRHYFTDKLNYTKDFMLTIEHGPAGNMYPVDYRSVAFFYADNTMNQKLLNESVVEYPVLNTLLYRATLLKILSFKNGTINSGKVVARKKVVVYEPANEDPMLVKFELNAPEDGLYNLYCSYFQSPSSDKIMFMQRQVALTDWISVQNNELKYIDKEYIGNVNVKDGVLTVTLVIQGANGSQFMLDQIVLEKK